jgi:type II secretory pathway pseudopilin PulG
MHLLANNGLSGLRERAFTMVEVALSLAVVAFALVAIIGILPTGMTVQKDNREDTLMNQEGRFWIEALKSGARGLHDLTNHVEQIKIEPASGPYSTVTVDNKENTYLTSTDIISLLSVPKYEYVGTNTYTNRITARVKAITGPAVEQAPFTTDPANVPNVFRYQLQTEIVPHYPLPTELVKDALAASTNNLPLARFNEGMGSNLWDVRIILRWPVVERGNGWFVGNSRKTFRAQVSGELRPQTQFSTFINRDNLAVLRPNTFDVKVGIQQP